ncbi:MAG: hydrogenase, partial [Candidatus Electrothrix sp. AR4]|nr:hydrogenase [Candidatus Electrothrix sp. AR4]
MLKVIRNKFEQGYRTSKYPEEKISLYKRFRGLPSVDTECDPAVVKQCTDACPQDAINPSSCRIDLGKCVFCGLCETLSDGKFARFSQNFEMGTAARDDLLTHGGLPALAEHSKKHFKRLFGRSLQLRQISAGGCNACEADTNVLNTPFFDLSRFGI